MSVDGSSHTFSSVTVTDTGKAHLGDTYQYFAYNARETVYQSTLTTTIRDVLASKDLQRALLVVVDVESRIVSYDECSRMLKDLEQLLSRLQEMEQRGLTGSNSARDFLEAAEGDFKTCEYKRAVEKTLRRVEKLATKTCTSSQSDICLDELCGLVQRMSRQISARICVREAISGLRHDDETQQASLSDTTPLLPTTNSRQLATAVDEAEYVYASQDFWRQLALVLKQIMVKETTTYRTDWLLGYLVIFAIAAIIALTFMITMSMTDAPKEDQGTVPLTFFVFFFFPLACFWTFITVLKSCGYQPTKSESDNDTSQPNLLDGTV